MPDERSKEWNTSTQKNRRDFLLKNCLFFSSPNYEEAEKGSRVKQRGD